jgi:quinoprotein glucose dehydrogenase|tara:strand:- start:1036 stop:3426 length:2391 start_codon:yes stop_codon:yes gene_type:complete
MLLKNLKLFLLISLIFLSIFYLNLTISAKCKSIKIFKSSLDFGISHLNGCYSHSSLVPEIKVLLSNSPFLYEVARKYRKNFSTSGYILDTPPTKEELVIVEKKENLNKDIEIPFIKGLLNNNDGKNYLVKGVKFQSENWGRSHGDHQNSKFHPSKQINKKNIKNLKLLWKYEGLKNKKSKKNNNENSLDGTVATTNIESNPIFVDNKIISISADWRVVANDAISGKLIWDLQSLTVPGRRGIVAYKDTISNKNYVFIPLGNKIYKINVNNGDIEKDFGTNGFVKSFTLVAPMIYENQLIIVGTSSISTFNIKNGKKIKKYSLRNKKQNFVRGAIWGGVALDQKKGIVFANTGNPQPGIYGTKRPGINKNANSVIAFDLIKEKIIWVFQETAHDLWDFDLAAPPILHQLKIENKIYEVVISASKTGNTLILERSTGKPIFDINYKRAPKSSMPGDFASPFQMFIDKPERFSKIEFNTSDFDGLPKGKITEINKKIKNAKYGWFETPSLDYDLITFGLHGGAQWMGSSIDPINQYLYIPTNNVPWKIRPFAQSREIKTFFSGDLKKYHNLYLEKCASCHGKKRNGKYIKFREREIKNIPSLVGYYAIPGMKNKLSDFRKLAENHKHINFKKDEINKIKILFEEWDKKIKAKNEIKIEGNGKAWSQFLTSDGLPASNPPWGYIAKLNLVTGKIEWKAPYGDININGETMKVGTTNFGGTALNGSNILFFTGTEDSKAYAIDADTGKELWSFKMEAAGSAPPTIFEINGKQYVSFLSTGGNYHNYKNKSSTLYTFAIDNK